MLQEKFLNTSTKVALQAIKPKREREFKPGAILYSVWGHGQKNVNFYCVVMRTEKTVNIIPMSAKVTTGKFEDTKIPLEIDNTQKVFRKVIKEKSDIINSQVKIKYVEKESFEQFYLWDGKPKKSTNSSFGH